ncbi:hypothetical protein HYS31_03775 [Candidatus Woesearchaeota archaeon]|nr:hypothetical protein [Candidatus Woesearchaeota archaeon]
MASLGKIDRRLKSIEDRNKRVESDKEWELSWTRRFLLMIFTYLSIGFYLHAIKIAEPWLNAIVPAVAFMLSTLTLPFFKRVWLKYKSKNA